jgi:hypothetical protein
VTDFVYIFFCVSILENLLIPNTLFVGYVLLPPYPFSPFVNYLLSPFLFYYLHIIA